MTTYTKTCTRCQQQKEENEFSPLKHARDGRQSQCILCMTTQAHVYRKTRATGVNASASKYYYNNRDKALNCVRKWRARNRDKVQVTGTIASNKRRAAKLQAMPLWLNNEQLEEIRTIYAYAKVNQLDVDHIVPLQGKTVCGLHVPWNLEAIPKPINMSKGNRFNDWK